MKQLIALIRREYWENKGAFRTTPLVIGGLNVLFLLMAMFTTAHIDSDLYTFREGIKIMGEQPEALRGAIMYNGMLGSSVLFTVVMSFVVFFYLLGVHAIVWPQARYILPGLVPMMAFAGVALARMLDRLWPSRREA